MKFWDTSAILPLLVEELSSDKIAKILVSDSLQVVWWGTSIECVSAISRLERSQQLALHEATLILKRLEELRSNWREVLPSAKLKQVAERNLRLHPLRAQDAQQLAGCMIANLDHKIEFVTLDQRLQEAALREGLALGLG
jgi:hypothetical protein